MKKVNQILYEFDVDNQVVSQNFMHPDAQLDKSELVNLAKACLFELSLKGEAVMVERAVHLQEVAAKLRAIMEDLKLPKEQQWNVDYAYTYTTVNRAFVSVKSPDKSTLKLVRAALAAEGFGLERHSSDSELRREMYFLKNDALLQAWFYDDKASCRYVKVGEKLTDVMELQCD